jgi:glycerate kinase
VKKKILIAPDKFKGSLSAADICYLLKDEMTLVIPDVQIVLCPLADGGDGTLEILSTYLELKKQKCITVDPLGRSIEAIYYTSHETAYIEMASASGYVLLDETDRNPMHTSTFGTGRMILDALKTGKEHIYLFLGGSATNDGGMGIANAFGYTFQDGQGNILEPIGASLRYIDKIVPPSVSNKSNNIKSLTLYHDVTNPPFGPNGAAQVYAKQKGANRLEVEILDIGLQNLCGQIRKYNGTDLSGLVGGGAAGGVAICLTGLLEAEMKSGMPYISEISNLDQKIRDADLIIGGEGRLDGQSLDGKVVSKVAELCQKYDKEMWLVVGKNELSSEQMSQLNIDKIFSVMNYAIDESDAITNASEYIRHIGRKIGEHLSS